MEYQGQKNTSCTKGIRNNCGADEKENKNTEFAEEMHFL